MTDLAIRYRGVSKVYPDGTAAVDNLDLDVPAGSLTVFVGPSGCGKTTSLRMLNRMVEPSSGTVEVNGQDVASIPAAKLRPALQRGLDWVRRMETISRPHRLPGLARDGAIGVLNNLAFILAALLLMAPFGFVPFSNTLPAVALLLFSIGFLQRDGGAVLLGHLANVATIVYFTILIGGGGVAARELWQRMAS